ncbi:hypothetical protein AWC38_SpisGene9001 [Stylophora pistillata]|uniref:HTH psq-type domain-containing protein n=1 Tax=Stylophora pistillata TaxID=50429 RepID=A0A2B4SA84_STYPI|nr:hypothetical protein AWC38_SpisGene9001 [Stylophora pistillata]
MFFSLDTYPWRQPYQANFEDELRQLNRTERVSRYKPSTEEKLQPLTRSLSNQPISEDKTQQRFGSKRLDTYPCRQTFQANLEDELRRSERSERSPRYKPITEEKRQPLIRSLSNQAISEDEPQQRFVAKREEMSGSDGRFPGSRDIPLCEAKKDVAAQFKVPPNTISTWLKNKDKIVKAFEGGSHRTKSRLKASTCDNVEEDFDALRHKDAELAPTEVRAEDVIEADDGVMTSDSALLSDKEILEEFRERDSTVMEVDDDSDDDDSEERPQKPTRAQITEAINTLSSYSLFAADVGADEIRRNMNQIAYIIEKNICKSQRLLAIDTFLS